MGASVRAPHRRRRSHRAAVEPPHERDGPDGRPRHRARTGQGARGCSAARARTGMDHGGRPGPEPPRHRAGRHPRRTGRGDRHHEPRDAGHPWPARRADRRPRRRTRYPPPRADPHHGIARRGIPRPHRRIRRVPDQGDGMTTTSATTASPATRTTPYRLTFTRALRSEWIKLSTLRSTWWSIGIVAARTIGIALLIALASTDPDLPGIPAVVPIGQASCREKVCRSV